MFIVCLWIAMSVEIYSKKWQVTSLCVDKNGLFNFFSGRKKTTNEASWSEITVIFKWTAFFGGESGFRGQQHHSLGITSG